LFPVFPVKPHATTDPKTQGSGKTQAVPSLERKNNHCLIGSVFIAQGWDPSAPFLVETLVTENFFIYQEAIQLFRSHVNDGKHRGSALRILPHRPRFGTS
jgi:hypothetical protein